MYPIEEIELEKWLDGDELDTFWKENFQGLIPKVAFVANFLSTKVRWNERWPICSYYRNQWE